MVTSVPLEDPCIGFLIYIFFFPKLTLLWVRIYFWEDLWWGDQPLCCQFPRFFRVIIKKNLSISVILDNFSFSSWNLNFYCNLANLEIKDLERLVSSLNHVHLSSSFADARGWSLPSLGLFLVIFFLLFVCGLVQSIKFMPLFSSQTCMEIQSPN